MNKNINNNYRKQHKVYLLKIFLPIIYVVIALWTIGFLRLFLEAIWDICSTQKPLIINGELTTWNTTIGFIVLLCIMWSFGLFSMILGVRLINRIVKGHAGPSGKNRKEKKKGSGYFFAY